MNKLKSKCQFHSSDSDLLRTMYYTYHTCYIHGWGFHFYQVRFHGLYTLKMQLWLCKPTLGKLIISLQLECITKEHASLNAVVLFLRDLEDFFCFL